MPSGNLPALNFLGSGQRTTGEFQAAVNELQNYVVSLKNEIDALSNTIVKESAVRTVGSATGEIPDKAVLDTRLGTTGNLDLGTASTKDFGVSDGNLPEYQESTVELGGDFDAGENIKCIRVGNLVCISAIESLSHDLNYFAASSTGAIPTWARPSGSGPVSGVRQTNVYNDSGSVISQIQIAGDGTLSVNYGLGNDNNQTNFPPHIVYAVNS